MNWLTRLARKTLRERYVYKYIQLRKCKSYKSYKGKVSPRVLKFKIISSLYIVISESVLSVFVLLETQEVKINNIISLVNELMRRMFA